MTPFEGRTDVHARFVDLEEVCQNPNVCTCPPLSGFPCQTPPPSQASRDATGHSEGECVNKAWAAPNARNFPSISLESPSQVSIKGQPHRLQAASFPRGLPSPLPSPTGICKTKGLQIKADPPKPRPLLPFPVPTA